MNPSNKLDLGDTLEKDVDQFDKQNFFKNKRHGILKNKTCFELLIGNICYYSIGQVLIFIFANNRSKLSLSLGFIVGVLMSVAMVIHMTISLEQAMHIGENGGSQYLQKHTGIRLAIILIILIVIAATNVFNVLATFVGIMALKVSAYLQPLTHKVLVRKNKKRKVKMWDTKF